MMTSSHNDQTILISFHANIYRSIQSRLRYTNEISLKDLTLNDQAYLFLIQEALKRLSQEEQRLLSNDFLSPLSKNWWMEYYSKSTYYRLRYLAVDRFLHCLHHEKMI
ncbi:MAG: hypothetical protein HGB31_09680 [Erysipelotrichaceae bacterium]|nr:hypothetical protein [Erysipelotrichaceae bacterium]